MNNDQEESMSSAVYKYYTSTNAAFCENFPDYREGYQHQGIFKCPAWIYFYKKITEWSSVCFKEKKVL